VLTWFRFTPTNSENRFVLIINDWQLRDRRSWRHVVTVPDGVVHAERGGMSLKSNSAKGGRHSSSRGECAAYNAC
jgi:hypothetical protein